MIRCADKLVLVSLCIGVLTCEMAKAQERPGHNRDAIRLQTQVGHTANLSSANFSPDGRMVLTASHDSTACLWDTATGRELRRFIGHTDSVTSAAFAPHGRTVVTSSKDRTARLWDIATGQEVRRLEGHTSWVGSAVFSPDGRLVLTGGWDATLRLWDTSTGQELRRFTGFSNSVTAVFAPDGRTILTMSQAQPARLWSVATGQELRRFADRIPFGVSSAVFSPDGRLVLTGSADGTTYLWDTTTGRELHRFTGDAGTVTSAVLAPDGRTILTVTQNTIRLSDVATGRELRRFTNEGFLETSVVFAPDGRTILTARGITACLWDLTAWKEVRRFEGYALSMTSPVFSPDGRTILTASHEGTARLWDATTWAEVRRFEGHTSWIYSAVFSPDGRFILTGSADTTARLWDTATGQELRRFQSPDSQPVFSAAFSPDGKSVLTRCSSRSLCLWSAATGQELRRFEDNPQDPRSSVALAVFSPDGHTILVKGMGLLLLKTGTGKELRRFTDCTKTVTSVAFSPDGQFVLTAAGWEGTACLWNAATGQWLRRFDGHTGLVTSAVFSPDSRWVLTTSHDGTARLWDAASGRELKRLKGHTGYVESAVFSPDGQFALTAGNDHTIRRWNVQTGNELARLVSFTDGTWVIATPEGRFDTNNLEELKGLHWLMLDDPLRPLPLEIFMRDYYEPRLLPRVLAGKELPEIRSLAELNRAQPKLDIVEVNRERDAEGHPGDTVAVTVGVAGASETFGLEGQQRRMETGAYDLRLFRDGQLVGQEPPPGNRTTTVGSSAADELQQWRQERRVVELKDGTRQIVFKGVRLPQRAGVKEVSFSAYAFNEDRVKSKTARRPFAIPTDLNPRRPRAYLVTVGVNAFEDEHWDLRYAVNDAKQLGDVLTKQLEAQRDAQGQARYEQVVWVGLTAESQIDNEGHRQLTKVQANKAQIEAVLKALAGQPVNADALQGITHTEQLRRANPEDLILVAFSSHGEVDDRGRFYLLPHDIGTKATEQQRRARSISNDELSAWLHGLDVIDFGMIVDACHSAASVESADFKPGPMGSRGLGQLAYDKGMRILAASQSMQSANETQETKMGLLSYALVREGLEENKADYKPKDRQIWLSEWLSYAAERVPRLDQDRGREKGKVLVAPKENSNKTTAARQQPALFNFARQQDVLIGRAQ